MRGHRVILRYSCVDDGARLDSSDPFRSSNGPIPLSDARGRLVSCFDSISFKVHNLRTARTQYSQSRTWTT